MITKIKTWIKDKWLRFRKWFLIVFGVSVALAAGTQLQTTDKISQTAIKEKFAVSTLASKYVSEGSSFRIAVKPDWKEKTEVRIGEETSADFEPAWELRKWDEVRVKLTPKLDTKVAKKDKTLDFVGDKMIFKNGTKEEIEFYDVPNSTTSPEGGYEIQWNLNEKPVTNKVEFTLETQGLDFFYQPVLTQEEIDGGASRPENVVGSYAVYASEQKTNWEGGKLYRTGKIGHIYRPKIIDSAGTEVWGDLHIEPASPSLGGNGILSITIPQDFLDNAVYPVRHAAGLTFGYTTLGSSNSSYIADFNYSGGGKSEGRGGVVSSPASNGTLSKISVGLDDEGTGVTSGNIKGFVNLVNGGGANSHTQIGAGSATGINLGTAHFVDVTLTGSIVASTNYILNAVGDSDSIPDGTAMSLCTDAGGSVTVYFESKLQYDSPESPWTQAAGSSQRYSIYATYTAAGGTVAPERRVIIVE